VDEVKLWTTNPPLTACADRFCPAAGNEPNLFAYWNFDQGTGGGNNAPLTTITDQTANGNDGAAANFAGTGLVSNLVNGGAPLVGPSLHGLNLTVRDYPYQTAPLTTICSGDPAPTISEYVARLVPLPSISCQETHFVKESPPTWLYC